MKLKWVIGVCFALSAAFMIFILFPRTYDVEAFEKRDGTAYWELDTGSKIGYTKISASTSVSSQKYPILYLHGGPGGRVHDKVIETLKPLSNLGHDLYFYDQVGSGHSQRLSDISEYSVERHKNDLRAIVSQTGSDKVILIAHSWGCLLAVNYLEDYSETVERIVFSGPGPILPIRRQLRNVEAPDSLNLIEPEFSNREGNKKANNLKSWWVQKWAYIVNSKLASDAEMDDFFTHLNQELSKSTDCTPGPTERYKGGGGYYSHIMTVKSFYHMRDNRDKLKNVHTPILLLRGQCDNQKWGFAKEYVDLFSNASLKIIEGVGHDILSRKGDEYYQLIKAFLST